MKEKISLCYECIRKCGIKTNGVIECSGFMPDYEKSYQTQLEKNK